MHLFEAQEMGWAGQRQLMALQEEIWSGLGRLVSAVGSRSTRSGKGGVRGQGFFMFIFSLPKLRPVAKAGP